MSGPSFVIKITDGDAYALVGPFDTEEEAAAKSVDVIGRTTGKLVLVEEVTPFDIDNLPLLPSDFKRMKPRIA